MHRSDSRIPVTVLTGFLGSGKTTLLRRALSAHGVRNVAVLVNEVGAIGIDQEVLGPLADDLQLLANGCICCTVREDLRKSLAALLDRSGTGAIARVVIETTGLADPMPILNTFEADPMLKFHFRIGGIVTAVDCINASTQLQRYRECTIQIAAADRVVLTKTDLADAQATAQAGAAIARLNPAVPIVTSTVSDEVLAVELFAEPAASVDEATRFCRLIAANLPAARLFPEATQADLRHEPRVTPFCIAVEGSFDWSAFALWLTMLLHAHGDQVLRVKGILNVADSSTPVLINGVNRLIYRPEHLPRWPGEDRRSVLVFIVADLDPEAIRHSFESFVR